MEWLVNLGYAVFLLLTSPIWLVRIISQREKYSQGWGQKLLGCVPYRRGDRACLWFHAVSVGEVNLLRPLLDEVRRRWPEVEIVLSTTTRSGMEVARRRYPEILTFYCPMDWSWAVHNALARIRPSALILTELEIWPNLIAAAHKRGVLVMVVNGRLGDRSFRGYRLLRLVLQRTMRQIDLVAAQDATSAQRFTALGVPPERVFATGSLKFDGAESDRNNRQTRHLRDLAQIQDDEVVFLAGSTQQGEEAAALKVFTTLCKQHPELRLILVPRHPERFDEVAALLAASGLPWRRRTQLEHDPPANRPGVVSGNPGPTLPAETSTVASSDSPEGLLSNTTRPIILVDTVGELGGWWGLADIAFVGGSFGNRGGQNMLEPAAYGAAVSFGPNTWNFRDIVRYLLAAEAAVVVRDETELLHFVERCLNEPEFARRLGENARRLVAQHRGATQRTADLLARLLAERNSPMQLPLRRSA